MTSRRFRLNEPDVTFETFEGEVLVIHLGCGNDYSLRGTAPLVWPWLAAGCRAAEIGATLVARGAEPAGEVLAAVDDFVTKLIEEKLLVERAEEPAPAPLDPAGPRITAFAPPSLESYRDMQDLLLLDPIHEVDVTGWPARPPETGQA